MYMLTTIQDKDHYNSLKYHHCYALNAHRYHKSVIMWPLRGRDLPGRIRVYKIKPEKARPSLTQPFGRQCCFSLHASLENISDLLEN